ncbi:MAG: alpha-glucosidase C-terminal domain-containing protein [Spirochaetales bacterium]|nr:alpha-glucosidase C-terminal domain-containing protein [Spirochaetales bacterium]
MHWYEEAVFYHIYPLGFLNAEKNNDFTREPVNRFQNLNEWLDYFTELGITAVYFGPLFESSRHGYDTADYFRIDRRLGTNNDFASIVRNLHDRNIKVVLDGVFHHVGRDFWAFRDLQEKKGESPYASWFTGVNFNQRSPYNDSFSYEAWEGHFDLVKLDLKNQSVKDHLFEACKSWILEYDIDGLRLDVAYCLDWEFLKDLRNVCKSIKEDFWIMGEVLHGDYRLWANPLMLDSVTNYECYKGLYSSHNDANYFEIAHSLERQFGPSGLYRDMLLYSFADNHDVNRVASLLKHKPHLYPLYILLFTMPGIPSLYYGSEWGMEGTKNNGDDSALRPVLEKSRLFSNAPQPALFEAIKKLIRIRRENRALLNGTYSTIQTKSRQFVFLREREGERIIVAVNADEKPADMDLSSIGNGNTSFRDLLNNETLFYRGRKVIITIPPNWARIGSFSNK